MIIVSYTQILIFYLIINSFISGYYFCDNYRSSNTKYEKYTVLFYTLLTIFFGLVYLVICFVLFILTKILNFLDKTFQFRFWFGYVFTNKWNNVDISTLKRLNNAAKNKTESTIKNNIYKYCVELINKRNDYIYIDSDDIQF